MIVVKLRPVCYFNFENWCNKLVSELMSILINTEYRAWQLELANRGGLHGFDHHFLGPIIARSLTAVFFKLVQCQSRLNRKIQPFVVEGIRFTHTQPIPKGFGLSAFLKVIHAPKTFQDFFTFWQLILDMVVFIRFMKSPGFFGGFWGCGWPL